MKRYILSLIVLLFFTIEASSQSHFELGGGIGLANYSGDLSPSNVGPVIAQSHLAFGGLMRYNINARLSARLALNYAIISGSDQLSGSEVLESRNLSFSSDIYELSTGLEINLFPFSVIEGETKFTPYGTIGFGVFKFDPVTEFEGKTIRLQPLGTEGQGTSEKPDLPKYNLVQFNIPFGGGVKFKINEQITGFAEMLFRWTFTDYLDDVSTTYPNFETLISENGELAAQLSNRTGAPVEPGSIRGGASINDYYATGVVGLSFSFNKGGSNISLRGKRKRSSRKVKCPKF